MNGEELRALQGPLKARYKDDPKTAAATLIAKGRVSQHDLSFTLLTGKGATPAGLHPAAGGDGSKSCSAEMLLEALISCAGVTLAAVATSMGIELGDATVLAEGELDFRGTLGTRDVPVGFTRIRVTFQLATKAEDDKIAKLVELTERYCVVFQTLRTPAELVTVVAPSSSV